MATDDHAPNACWVTLLTNTSYLPGVIVLAHSLLVQNSKFPLIVLVTPSLNKSSRALLELEALHNPLLKTRETEPLTLLGSYGNNLAAQRFEGTWTKLRAFELTSYDTCVFLDADMVVFKNVDELLHLKLPSHDWIAACHCCVCNLDKDPWAAANWTRANCAYTPLSHPSALMSTVIPPESEGPPHTHALLNGGLFLFHPSTALWTRIFDYFITSTELSTFKFPDQDFLAAFFVHKWLPLSWKYNALKTMRGWHPNIWRDEEVKVLHYIVDKPWARRNASDKIAGHLGRDGATHWWWWDMYEAWRTHRGGPQSGQENDPDAHPSEENYGLRIVKMVDATVAPPLDDYADQMQCKENRKKGLPVPIPKDQDKALLVPVPVPGDQDETLRVPEPVPENQDKDPHVDNNP